MVTEDVVSSEPESLSNPFHQAVENNDISNVNLLLNATFSEVDNNGTSFSEGRQKDEEAKHNWLVVDKPQVSFDGVLDKAVSMDDSEMTMALMRHPFYSGESLLAEFEGGESEISPSEKSG